MISEEDRIYMQDTNKVEKIQKGQNSDFTNYLLQSLSEEQQNRTRARQARILF